MIEFVATLVIGYAILIAMREACRALGFDVDSDLEEL